MQTVANDKVDLSLTYDPFGSITSGADENFVGFAYNGEESNQVTGLQYLRARYYNTELGSFLTMDSYLGSLTDTVSQNRYTYANNNPVNNIDPSGHYSVNVNGAMQYYQSTGLNELRDYMTSAALWSGQVNAQNGFNRSVATAQNTSMFRYQSISGISQATANSYIYSGIAKAGQVSMNYGCTIPTLGNQAVAKFANNVNAAKNTANRQISNIKANKKAQYDAYVAYQAWLAQQRRLAEQRRLVEQRVLGAQNEKKYKLEIRNDINGIGLKSDGTILYGHNASHEDVLALIAIDRMSSSGYSTEEILAFIEKYTHNNPDSTIVPGKTIEYYTNFEDITQRLTGEMIRNEYMNATYYSDGQLHFTNEVSDYSLIMLVDFYYKVRNKGEWDLKQKVEWQQSSLYIFDGEVVDRDAPGNIMYGYMGKAYGVSDSGLYTFAGLAQIIAGTSTRLWIEIGTGDDPIDSYNVKRGIEYYNRIHYKE